MRHSLTLLKLAEIDYGLTKDWIDLLLKVFKCMFSLFVGFLHLFLLIWMYQPTFELPATLPRMHKQSFHWSRTVPFASQPAAYKSSPLALWLMVHFESCLWSLSSNQPNATTKCFHVNERYTLMMIDYKD